jgi:hypothetical protein
LVAAFAEQRLRQDHRRGGPQLAQDQAGIEIGVEQGLVGQPGRGERIGDGENRGRALVVGDAAKLGIKQRLHPPGHDVGAVIKHASQLALLEPAADPAGEQVDEPRGQVGLGLTVAQP